MQKVFHFGNNPEDHIWDKMWYTRTIEKELETCEMESPPRDLFLANIPLGAKIVDAGCGFGKWVIYLKRRGYNIVGIDSNEQAIAKLHEFDRSLQVELGDILHMGYPDNHFDAYISMGVVEHFEEGPRKALMEAYRVVKPDALVFVSVPTVNIIRRFGESRLWTGINFPRVSILRAVRLVLTRPKQPDPMSSPTDKVKGQEVRYSHFVEYRYSKAELEDLLTQSGFKVVTTVPHDFYGSKRNAVGLTMDLPYLAVRGAANCELNLVGRVIWRTLNVISPWIACSSVICVGKSLKRTV